MKLVKAHVTNFRSAEDSGEFELDQVTALVGKNEAGKSAILLALAALNPHPSTPAIFDKERDYPRRLLTSYAQRHPKEDAIAVTTVWELTDDEIAEVEYELGEGVLGSKEVKISRRYGGSEPEWSISFNVQKSIDNALAGNGFDDTQIATLRTAKNTKELIDKLGTLPAPTPEQAKLLERLKNTGT